MTLEGRPALPPDQVASVRAALQRAGLGVGTVPATYRSSWRAAGLRDAVEEYEPEGYAPSPRSTRGATRA